MRGMPTQRCSRCGTPRRGDLQVCVRCEAPFTDPLDVDAALPRPAAPATTQSHGSVLLAVLAGFVVLAVLLGLSVRGVGPFEARIVDSTGTGDTRMLTVEITNEGERAGRGNCQVVLAAGNDPRRTETFTSQKVGGGETIRQTVEVDTENDAEAVRIRCR
jgi:hypothetical protein